MELWLLKDGSPNAGWASVRAPPQVAKCRPVTACKVDARSRFLLFWPFYRVRI